MASEGEVMEWLVKERVQVASTKEVGTNELLLERKNLNTLILKKKKKRKEKQQP